MHLAAERPCAWRRPCPQPWLVPDTANTDHPPCGAVAGLDPGRSKCGLVLSDPDQRRVVVAALLSPAQTLEQLGLWRQTGALRLLVIGDGTGSRAWEERLRGQLAVRRVDERGTTLAARQRYWQLFPPRGWRCLLPPGLRQPPRDWDDVVAQLLLERWLGHPLARAAGLPLRRQPSDAAPAGETPGPGGG